MLRTNSGRIVGFLLVVGMVLNACGGEKVTPQNWQAKAPGSPGTAETLTGTQWDFGPNSILFQAEGKCQLGAQGGATALSECTWSIDNGVVSITMNEKSIATGTWDGTTLVVNGFAAEQVGASEEQ